MLRIILVIAVALAVIIGLMKLTGQDVGTNGDAVDDVTEHSDEMSSDEGDHSLAPSEDAVEGDTTMADDVMDAVEETAEDVVEDMGEAAESAADSTEEMTEEVTDAVEDVVEGNDSSGDEEAPEEGDDSTH